MNDELNEGLQSAIQQGAEILTTYGLSVIGAVITLVAGWFVARLVRGWVARGLARLPQFDPTLIGFFASLVYYGVLIVTFLAVLDQFGVETTSLVAVLGAAGLAIGLALQGTLSNVAAGVMLLIFRPFRIGQYVEIGGQGGTVKSLQLFTTELATPDNVQVIMPNAAVWGQPIRNYSFHQTRRMDITLSISYEDDIDAAIAMARKVVDDEPRILEAPQPMVVVGKMAESSVDIIVRVWVANTDYWDVVFHLNKALKQEADKAGITIPFPQRVIRQISA